MTLRARLGGKRMLVLGHRGDPRLYPENTLAGFDSALRAGADGVELDLRLSADSVPMVMHDPNLLRTVGVDLEVSTASASQLQQHDVPRLVEALEVLRGRGLAAVEIKDAATSRADAAEAVIATLRSAAMDADAMLLSFDHPQLRRARQLDPDAFTVALLGELTQVATLVGRLDCNGIGPRAPLVDAALVADAHAAGAIAVAWTVDDIDDAMRLAAMGCDVLITNRPAAMVSALTR